MKHDLGTPAQVGSINLHNNAMSNSPGSLIRAWRTSRKLSQMDLALEIDISPRHLSFVETGRAKPSVEVLISIAEKLDVPLRVRNSWLLAAGYAPRYTEQSLSSTRMVQVTAALRRLLDAHDPYPGVVLDRHWNVVLMNQAAENLVSLLPQALRTPKLNIFKASLHPEGLAAFTENFAEWGTYLLQTLHRVLIMTRDEELMAISQEIHTYSTVAQLKCRVSDPMSNDSSLLIPCALNIRGQRLSLFTTLTSFGSPRDITLHELCVELFYPADEHTTTVLNNRLPELN
jgi:transcriptional regulator with XRE-family HTH domain